MENNTENRLVESNPSQEILERIEQAVQKQSQYAKWQCILTAVMVACCVGIFLFVSSVLPELQALSDQTELMLTDMKHITEQLAQADLESMVHNVDKLVTTSQTGVEQAVDKLNALDLETLNNAIQRLNTLDLDTLNRAIKDLSSVIEPMAKFFNLF